MIGIAGAGAFGTALAIALAREGKRTLLWARDAEAVSEMQRSRTNPLRLPGISFPETISITSEIDDLSQTELCLLSVPTQALGRFLSTKGKALSHIPLVACSKGVDLATLKGPTAVISDCFPGAVPALLTGPSFATDVARGLPTALTLACIDDGRAESLQRSLSTPVLRLYRTNDVVGAELGGALKNVIAIAAGIVIGAGLGDSARAALMTRGYAEMVRLAASLGARPETLAGLSGLGDLVLTCTSSQSRNFRYGLSLGAARAFDENVTVEGASTAKAVSNLARSKGLDLPITTMIAALIDNHIDLQTAIDTLLSRPLKKE